MDKYLTSYIDLLANKKSKNIIGGMTGGGYRVQGEIDAMINGFGTNLDVLTAFFFNRIPDILTDPQPNPIFINNDLGDDFIQYQPRIVEMMCEKPDFNTPAGVLAAANAASVCRVMIPNPAGGGPAIIQRPIPGPLAGVRPPRPTFGPGVLKELIILAFCAQTEEEYIAIENELTRERLEEIDSTDAIYQLSNAEFKNILLSIRLDNPTPITRRNIFFNIFFRNIDDTYSYFIDSILNN